MGSLGQVVPESDSIELSGEKVPSFSFLLGMSPASTVQETLLLLCLEQLSNTCKCYLSENWFFISSLRPLLTWSPTSLPSSPHTLLLAHSTAATLAPCCPSDMRDGVPAQGTGLAMSAPGTLPLAHSYLPPLSL